MRDRPARILLLGTHGQHNIGDELLLETFLSRLGDTHRYVINTYDPADTAARLGTRYRYELIDTARDRWVLLRQLRRADMLVFAGGSILKELSAATGRRPYATLWMILAIVCATRWLTSVPIAMLHVGVGPIRTRRGRFLARRILNRVDLLSVRDPASTRACRRVGAKTPAIASADAVFSVSPAWLRGGAPGPDGSRPAGSAPLRIALSLNHDIEVPENWPHVLRTLGAAFTRLSGMRPIEIHGLPMQSRGKEHDDATVLRRFAAAHPSLTFVEHLPTTHADVARLVESCDVVVAERLHALITSAKLGIPVVPLVYDVKVRELAASLGVAERSVDLGGAFTAEEVVTAIEAAVDRPEARGEMAASVAALTDRARTDFARAGAWLEEHRR